MRWLTKTSPGANSGMPGRRYPSRRNLSLAGHVCRSMRTRIVALSTLAIAAAATLPAAAPASGWTPTQAIAVGKGYEPVPRVGIGGDGTSALAFRSKSGKLMLAIGRPSGRFDAPRAIDRAGARSWSVAARAGGRFIVVWEDTDGIRAAVRTRAGGPVVVQRVATSNGEEINGVQVAADPRGGWVVAERQFRRSQDRAYYVRAMTLTPARATARRHPGPRSRRLRHRRAPDAGARRQRHRPRGAGVQPRVGVVGDDPLDGGRLGPAARPRVHRAGGDTRRSDRRPARRRRRRQGDRRGDADRKPRGRRPLRQPGARVGGRRARGRLGGRRRAVRAVRAGDIKAAAGVRPERRVDQRRTRRNGVPAQDLFTAVRDACAGPRGRDLVRRRHGPDRDAHDRPRQGARRHAPR